MLFISRQGKNTCLVSKNVPNTDYDQVTNNLKPKYAVYIEQFIGYVVQPHYYVQVGLLSSNLGCRAISKPNQSASQQCSTKRGGARFYLIIYILILSIYINMKMKNLNKVIQVHKYNYSNLTNTFTPFLIFNVFLGKCLT